MAIVFKQKNKRSGKHSRHGDAVIDLPETNLSLYLDVPAGDISLETFIDVSCERHKMLLEIEKKRLMIETDVAPKDGRDDKAKLAEKLRNLRQSIVDEINEHMPIASPMAGNDELRKEQLKNDLLSHHILRLAVARDEVNDEMRRWFLQHELAVFKARFEMETDKGVKAFLAKIQSDLGIKYSAIGGDESEKENIDDAKQASGLQKQQSVKFYKVPCEDVLDLVKRRRVLVLDGQAYVPENAFINIICGLFRSRLSEGLAIARKRAFGDKQGPDERLTDLMEYLSKKDDYSVDTGIQAPRGQVTPDMLDGLNDTMFPLCMRNCHKALRRDHHLRHGARMQYGLFLKGIGLTLEDSLRFWKSELAKKVGSDKFEREYAYNIRHNYGQEGKRVDYTPYSCLKIIKGSVPGPNEAHGCPYRHWNNDRIQRELIDSLVKIHGTGGAMTETIKDIVTQAKDHCQLACRLHFRAMHPGAPTSLNIGTHPNLFFSEGVKIEGGAPDARYDTAIATENRKEEGEQKQE